MGKYFLPLLMLIVLNACSIGRDVIYIEAESEESARGLLALVHPVNTDILKNGHRIIYIKQHYKDSSLIILTQSIGFKHWGRKYEGTQSRSTAAELDCYSPTLSVIECSAQLINCNHIPAQYDLICTGLKRTLKDGLLDYWDEREMELRNQLDSINNYSSYTFRRWAKKD
ncbi:MAG: hypothetical protein QNK23_14215 [Crocinitomicaceae bacterium]|nr:hypothetical protein [Crocinitomicaceae bacterium]